MDLKPTLNKENFWDECMVKYPKATKEFCDWIDEYKKQVDWINLFAGNGSFPTFNNVKFHTIPYEMQMGIWIEFLRQQKMTSWISDLSTMTLEKHIDYYFSLNEKYM